MHDEPSGTNVDTSQAPPVGRTVQSPRSRSARAWFDGSLFGLDGRRTALALRALVGLCCLHVVSALARIEIGGVRLQTLSPAFDALSTVLILVGLLVATLGPVLYAVWNGGPALAFVIALAPEAVGELLAQRWILDLDLAVSLTAGAAGAAAALAVTLVRTDSSLPDEPLAVPSRQHALTVGILVAGSAGMVSRFALQAPTRVLSAYQPFALYWVVPIAVGVLFTVSLRRRAA